ncbi:hypothetical protein E2C01_090803 [Portunus trituberculatus]|uniref:Uncharacterized protein n=1 Tax=Portunus trituberculatus TaxID=210409 RepID=A0A5B7JLV2_PORTR|nr:hypothetical protein [Portunus trituberculatus]
MTRVAVLVCPREALQLPSGKCWPALSLAPLNASPHRPENIASEHYTKLYVSSAFRRATKLT